MKVGRIRGLLKDPKLVASMDHVGAWRVETVGDDLAWLQPALNALGELARINYTPAEGDPMLFQLRYVARLVGGEVEHEPSPEGPAGRVY